MAVATLHQHERDVERARAKLEGDLAILRSPATLSSFKEDVKYEALEYKDALVRSATASAQSSVNNLLEDIKAKAAANPAAALAIGAGIAWRLVKHPPIATALVGTGLYSLLRTPAERRLPGVERDYLAEGKERLMEQASEFAATTKDAAAELGQTVSAKTAELVDTAKDKVQRWGDQARDATSEAGSTLRAKAEAVVDDASRRARALSDRARGVGGSSETGALYGTFSVQRGSGDQQMRDGLLLGVAGMAILAALGMAYQNRSANAPAHGEFD